MPRTKPRNITYERLVQVMDVDPLTGIFKWKVTLSNRNPAGKIAGAPHSAGYVCIQIDGENLLAHHLMWLFVHREWPKDQIDHRNRNRSDNRAENLRVADHSQNHQNIGLLSTNTSGFKGVSYCIRDKAWNAVIIAFKKRYYLGYFKSKEAANAAYVDAAKRLHGEFAYMGTAQ